ncbi:MAG TPA: VWA domain-containing protein [Thermoanaerobaculia bacterium]|nr:VWA domain-containing protein [Thermoanaerobaculia bacterium]
MRRVVAGLVPWLCAHWVSTVLGAQVPDRFRDWLESVDPLVTQRERDAFVNLATDADREAFVQRFWEVRDPYPETPRNEARERWESRLEDVRRRWGGTRDDRARVFLLNGEPDSVLAAQCDGKLLELWNYQPRFQVKDRTVLAFLIDPAGGEARLWRPGEGGLDLLAVAKEGRCAADAGAADALFWLRLAGKDGCDFVARRALSAPKPREWVSEFHPEAPAAAAALPSPETRSLQAAGGAEPVPAPPRPSLHITAPTGHLLAGTQRFEARVDEQIERVAFTLDGKLLLTRNRPPFIVQVDLGGVPRPHRLAAQGFGPNGQVLASDELMINGGAQRFAVRLVEPAPGGTYRQSLRARVDVQAPADRKVERVEIYLGDQRMVTLYQPPFVQPLVLPAVAGVGYVRAVAYLSDGTSAEDVTLLNAPEAEKMDVHLVNLYTNVGDRAGRPFEGLGAGDFQVFEDGVRQTLRQVERVDDTPLRLVTLLDNSASMAPRLEASRRAAIDFLKRTLRARDEAAVITFNKAPHVAVGLTGDLAALAGGFDGLMAFDDTALWDSLIYALGYLGGAAGQRAIVLLSDGEDHTSTYKFEDALESARRAGIAVYVLGIDLPRGEATKHLARLAAETGGRSFFFKSMNDLPGIYSAIEKDLRSRYRITYQSSNTRPGEAFRTVRVQVDKPGAEARTISGYYP